MSITSSRNAFILLIGLLVVFDIHLERIVCHETAVDDPVPDELEYKGKWKKNKISALMHMIHNKSEQDLFNKSQLTPEEDAKFRMAIKDLSDLDMMKYLCDQSSKITFKKVCISTVERRHRKKPEQAARIALAVRHKPDGVSPSRLMWHKMMSLGMETMHKYHIDEAVDFAVDTAAKSNPYVYIANKAISHALV